MSYSILYRPMFLKVKENMYIPIYEGGDNNVWECDNKRRSRSWSNTRFKGMENIYCGESELFDILNNIHEEVIQRYKEREDNYSDKQFGYFDSVSVSGKKPITTSWNDYLNFFKKGIQNSITFEEAKELRLAIQLTYYDIEDKYHFVYINTKEELFNMLDELKNQTKHLWVGYSSVSDRIYNFINCMRSKKSYSKNGVWVIETTKGYLKSFDGIKPVFTKEPKEALVFASNKIAAKISHHLFKYDITWCGYQDKTDYLYKNRFI